jgi:gamma-glutamyl:cysteine ligase YbdK (ATP-grasp superfamily)
VRKPLHLFEGYGVELEYILVRRDTLDVLPVSDEVLRAAAGRYVNEVESGPASWSNEFMLHVMEIKNNDPAPSLSGLPRMFQDQVALINRHLEPLNGMLMPSGMHPWMSPAREARLWPHRNRKIYETYDRIFGCRTHGFANIQSMQINLSFRGDGELGSLHAAVRLLLPLVPALAASSPIVEGRVTGSMDSRLLHYRSNQGLIPSVSGSVIPEAVYTRAEYKRKVLAPMYGDIGPYDREGTLRHEWLNSRGAVPRFGRSAMEIRLVDAQECPLSDLAVATAIVSVLKGLSSGRWLSLDEQAGWPLEPLVVALNETIRHGEEAVIRDGRYLKAFGYPEARASAAEVWRYLAGEVLSTSEAADQELLAALKVILERGPLSRRILRAAGNNPSGARLREVYRRLCRCLAEGQPFEG